MNVFVTKVWRFPVKLLKDLLIFNLCIFTICSPLPPWKFYDAPKRRPSEEESNKSFNNYALVKVGRDDDAFSPSVVDAVRADATGCDDADASLCPLSLLSVLPSVRLSFFTSDLNVKRVTFDVRES